MTAATRKNVYLHAHTLAQIGEGGSLSGSISTIIDRYSEIIRRARPWERLSEAEQGAILDACMGWWPDPAATIPGGIGLELRDADVDGLGQKWGVDVAQLAARVDAMHVADQIALVDWIERRRKVGGLNELSG